MIDQTALAVSRLWQKLLPTTIVARSILIEDVQNTPSDVKWKGVMSFYDTYIGDPNDPAFSWTDGDYNGNSPAALSMDFPAYEGSPLFQAFFQWVKRTECEYRQTDWGCWVAKVTKAQIRDFIEFCYGHDEDQEEVSTGHPARREKLKDLRAFVETLDEHQLYGLVALET